MIDEWHWRLWFDNINSGIIIFEIARKTKLYIIMCDKFNQYTLVQRENNRVDIASTSQFQVQGRVQFFDE
jgi:hypothetical protein